MAVTTTAPIKPAAAITYQTAHRPPVSLSGQRWTIPTSMIDGFTEGLYYIAHVYQPHRVISELLASLGIAQVKLAFLACGLGLGVFGL